MPCCRHRGRPPGGGRDEKQTEFIQEMADERYRMVGKGEHCTAKQRVAVSRMYARAISTFQAKVNNTNVSMLATDVF